MSAEKEKDSGSAGGSAGTSGGKNGDSKKKS